MLWKGNTTFKYPDIGFDKNPDFSESYQVLGNDEAEIRGIFSLGVISLFKLYKGRYVEVQGDTFLYCFLRERIGIGLMKLFLAEGNTIFRLF